MNANEFGRSFGITNPNDNRAAYIETGYKMAERNYKTAASRKSFMAGYMEYAPAAQGRCGTCGELKPVQNFTDGECNDCHFAVIEEAPETTPEPQRPEGYNIVEASQANTTRNYQPGEVFYVYASTSRPISASWARISDAVYVNGGNYVYTWVVVPYALDPAIWKSYELVLTYGPIVYKPEDYITFEQKETEDEAATRYAMHMIKLVNILCKLQ